MATGTKKKALPNGQQVDERKLLGLPADAELPTARALYEALRDAGLPVKARDKRAELLVAVAEAKTSERQAAQAAVRSQAGLPEQAAPAAKADKLPDEAVMAQRLRRKGYTGEVPTGQLATYYQGIVKDKKVPHSWPTGTRLQDVIDQPFTDLAVTPDPHQEVEVVVLQAVAGSEAAGRRRISQKANRMGMLVECGEARAVVVDGKNAWEAEVQYVPGAQEQEVGDDE